MVCKQCGNEMRDDARFCPSCGALNSPDPAITPAQGAAPAWEAPEGGGGRKKTGLFIGLGVAAAAVIALVVVFAGGLFGSPKAEVEKALLNSIAAYRAAEKKLGAPDMERWQQDQTLQQQLALELKGINSQLVGYDMSALEGLGLYLEASCDGSARTMSFDLGAYWGDEDLLSFQMAADDAELYFASPEFTGGAFYGMNTETLGEDLAAITGDDSIQSVSFNLFELVDLMLDRMDQEDMEQSLKEASKDLWDAAEVKKTGSMTLDLNGTSTKATAYRVTLSEEALNQYVDSLETTLSALNYYDLYEELYRSMGMPQDQIDEILSALEELDVYGDLADALRDAIEELGDVELDVCLSGGYVSAVTAVIYTDRISGSEVKLAVYLGGGEEYVDDLSVNVEAEDVLVEVKSTGDHGLKSGLYTDETTIRVRQDSSTVARVTSDLSIDPRGGDGSFAWKLSVDSSGLSICVLEMEGDLDMDQDHISLDLDEISVRAMGMEVCTLGFRYYADCHPERMDVGNPRMIASMSEQELMDLGLDLQSNAILWFSDMQRTFVSRLPDDLLWAMMGGF